MTENTVEESRPAETSTLHLRGVEKAAIVFLCLQEENGSELMQLFDENEIHQLTRAMATIGNIPSTSVEAVIREFLTQLNGSAGVSGSYDAAHRLLASFLPESKVSEIMSEIRQPENGRSTWETFSALNEQVIVTYLKGEHDQTIAAILSKVKSEIAARVLPLFGEERMSDIASRMIKLDSLPQIVIDDIERYIEDDILSAAKRKSGTDPHQRMADLFNRMDGKTFERLSDDLSKRAPQDIEAIKAKMFTFDDLVKLDMQSLSRLVRNCEGNQLPLALRGAKKPVREAFLGCLTTRAKENLEEQMQLMGSVRLRDVRDAQAEIIDVANALAQENIIRLPRDDDEMI